MATVNHQSVREEVERINVEFNQLVTERKVNNEIKMLFKSMLLIINLLISIFLEKTTKKNNKNSSKPSSQTEKDESSTLSNNTTNSKGKPESDITANNTRTVETLAIAKVTECPVCGNDLSRTPCERHERRTKIDIIFEKVVEQVDAEIKPCDVCDSTVKGTFPPDMVGPLQYGNGLKAYIINLLVCQMVSLNRVQKLVKSMIGELLSEASLLKFILRLHQALAQWETSAIEQIVLSWIFIYSKLSTPFIKYGR